MRLVTWNVNSIRARLDRVLAYLDRQQVDVLAMQETKCRDADFPAGAFQRAGYEVATWGFNQWNGVAIASRVGLAEVERGFAGQPVWGEPPVIEARAIGATCGPVRVWSLYVPHGRALDDPHYQYKLEFLRALRMAAAEWLGPGGEAADDSRRQLALLGDWNVAPLDTDVWDIADFQNSTHVSQPEREAFRAFETLGLREVTRERLPEPGRFTSWDYTQLHFPRNQGLRIDFAYCTPALANHVTAAAIQRDERKGKGASDHVPVELDIA